jgi:hypothetical protein
MLQLQDGATDGRRPGGGPVGPSINFATAWQQQSNQTPALLPHGPASTESSTRNIRTPPARTNFRTATAKTRDCHR